MKLKSLLAAVLLVPAFVISSFAQENAAPAVAPATAVEVALETPSAPSPKKTELAKIIEQNASEIVDTTTKQSVEAEPGWLAKFTKIVTDCDDAVWGVPLIAAILVVGFVLTVSLRLVHVFNLKRACKYMFNTEQEGSGEVSSFGALCTALSATIGTGNIVGVATAIGTGGPGALFWMEVAAFFGMATKFSEGLLAVKYREIGPDGKVLGGPFYYIEKGLKGVLGISWKWLAVIFAVFGTLAGLMGIGTITQVNGITSAVQRYFDPNFNPADLNTGLQLFGTTYSIPVIIAGLLVTICVALVVIGGLKAIARVSTVIVPFMAVFYVIICGCILIGNASQITGAIELIFKAAFNPQSFAGGIVGVTIQVAMQKGIARGIFSNEAGLGSAPIAAAAAKTNEPVRQGLVCMTGTFIDTIVICSMTGLAIVVTGAWQPELGIKGVDITIEAFNKGLAFLPHGTSIAPFFLMVSLTFFAFTTILGWDYYSEKCLEYIIGRNRRWAIIIFRVLYVAMVFVGPYLTVKVVWDIADIFNGLMAFPNLVALILLSPVVVRCTKDYFRRLKAGEIKE